MKFLLLFIASVWISTNALCNWVPVNSGFNDYFTSITYKNGKMLITGKKGAYLSTTGGITPGSWSRIESYASSSDSTIYNRSQFYSSAEATVYTTNIIYFCGRDTVNSTGVIFKYDTQANKIQLVHTGGTSFNKIANNDVNRIYAVGNNGMLVSFNESNPVIVTIPTSFTFNLTSVDASGNMLTIGANDYLINGVVDNSSPAVVSFTQHAVPGRNFKDVKFRNYSSTSGYALGKNMLNFQNGTFQEPHQYYADSLMGNSLLNVSGQFYIATNNGIYVSIYANSDIIEFCPTSNGFNVQGICSISNSHLVGCTANGQILYTNASGGTREPYAQIDVNGACLNVPQQITSTKGSVTNCTNYIDNVQINSYCGNFNYTFNTPGTHEIKMVVSNSFYSKTIVKQVLIVSPPINVLSQLSEDTLCKAETVDITMLNSENGVYYSLYQTGSNTFLGNSAVGDGNNLSFQSNLINQSGNYYIRAINSQASSCSRVLTNTFNIVVEKPEAKLYFDVINAEQNESVRFYQKSIEAVHFEWQFSNNPSISNSNLPDVVNSFADAGSSVVTLIAGTLNNCYDTAVVRGPFIYEPYTDASWMLVNSKIAGSTANSGYSEDIKQTIKSHSSGYFVAGDYLDRIVESRIGDSANLPGYGGYVAKYNDQGILKWCIKTDPMEDSSYPIQFVHDITEDGNGNIYVVGKTPANGMIDNKGNAIASNQNFIIKLDPLGNTIWNRTTNYYEGDFVKINHDYENSIYVTSLFYTNAGLVFPFRLNGVTEDSLRFTEAVCQTCNHKDKVIKILEDGQMEYDFMIENSVSNTYTYPQVVFDTLNNLYLWGSKELRGTIHAPADGEIIELTTSSSNFGGKMYIAKFDVAGNYLWKVEGHTQGVPNDNTEVHALISDGSGNLYMTGQNNFDNPSNPQVIVNADNTPSYFYGGHYFVAKINSNGITQWINGDYNSIDGNGFDLILDGDTLYTIGASRKNNLMDFAFELTGSNSSVSMEASPYNYYIAKYLTDGAILSSTLNGPSDLISGLYLRLSHYPKLIKLNDGYFLLNKSISNNAIAPDTAIDFGFNLIPSGSQDGTQIKFKLNQGVAFLPHYYTEITYPVCYGESFTYPDGTVLPQVTYYDSRIDSLVSANGTDSIIKHQVVVRPTYYTASSLIACQGSNVMLSDGTTIQNIQSTTSVDLNLQSIDGCDSMSTVTIYVTTINTNIAQNANHLSVQSPNSTFQWVDCNLNFFPVPNQTGSTFTPIEDGSFAVIITKNGCTDTSDCYLLEYYANLSVSESADPAISIAPNPTTGKTTIDFGQTIGAALLTVYSNDGRKIVESSIQGIDQYELDLGAFERGTYFVKITGANREDSGFLIVKH